MEERGLERFRVVLHKRAQKGLAAMQGNRRREALRLIEEFLPTTPLERVPGKVKKLKGDFEKVGMLQYDLPDGYRIQYWVDQASKTVYVDYLGPHP